MLLFPRKTLWCLRGAPLLFLSCEGVQRLQSVKDRRPEADGGKGGVSRASYKQHPIVIVAIHALFQRQLQWGRAHVSAEMTSW